MVLELKNVFWVFYVEDTFLLIFKVQILFKKLNIDNLVDMLMLANSWH